MNSATRRQQIEEMLKNDPNDEFLRYGLAMEHLNAGEAETAIRQLRDLIALNPAKPYVPAFQIAAQVLLKLGRAGEAIPLLRDGVAAAQKQGNDHAAGEMQVLLDSVE
jgi:predicted Zn-dependent protease